MCLRNQQGKWRCALGRSSLRLIHQQRQPPPGPSSPASSEPPSRRLQAQSTRSLQQCVPKESFFNSNCQTSMQLTRVLNLPALAPTRLISQHSPHRLARHARPTGLTCDLPTRPPIHLPPGSTRHTTRESCSKQSTQANCHKQAHPQNRHFSTAAAATAASLSDLFDVSYCTPSPTTSLPALHSYFR